MSVLTIVVLDVQSVLTTVLHVQVKALQHFLNRECTKFRSIFNDDVSMRANANHDLSHWEHVQVDGEWNFKTKLAFQVSFDT